MTTVTYRWLASYAVHDFEDIAVRVITGWDRDEPLDEYDRYEVVRNRRIIIDGGMAFAEERLLAYDTEDDAESKARALCIEGRSVIPGAFCLLDEYEEGYDEPLPRLDPTPLYGHLPIVAAPLPTDSEDEKYWRRVALGGEWDGEEVPL